MKEYVHSHTLQTASQIQIELISKGIRTSLSKVQNELTKAQSVRYPKDNSLAFTQEYCLSLDGTQIFQGYFKLPTEAKDKPSSEIVILCSNFILERLPGEWFVDGTFCTAPENFCQLLNAVIYRKLPQI